MRCAAINSITMLGAGSMGHGISQVAANEGYRITMCDIEQKYIDAGMDRIKKSLQKFVDKKKLSTDEYGTVLSRITTTTDFKAAVKEADVVIEAIPEKLELKKEIFKKIDGLCIGAKILASNTSTLSITEIASATEKPDRVVGMHFFNPVPLMKPVEIVRGMQTSDETVSLTVALAERLKKTPIVVKDSPGFASTRLGVALFIEASHMLAEGAASVKDIDNGARLFYGHRMGPFETCDLVGLDARLNNLFSLYHATGDKKWFPPLLLQQLVAAGYLGKKPGSKGGYYDYFSETQDKMT